MNKHPNTTCLNCGTEYYRSPSVIKRRPNSKTFCSRDCKTAYHRVDIECIVCGTVFSQVKSWASTNRPYFNTCSPECLATHREQFDTTTACNWCGKEFSVKRYRLGVITCCSEACRTASRAQTLAKHNPKKPNGDTVVCPNCGTKNYFPKNRIDAGARFCDSRCYGEWLVKTGARAGENNNAWNDNLTDEERELTRMTPETNAWREAVFQRDDYTCFRCHTRGGELNAHHMDGFNWYVRGRYDVDNGVTLCKSCHTDFHSIYGSGNNTSKQFIEWMRL